jgi:adenosylcobyric acid synthase
MSARAIMVLGTASHVGKSLLTAAICRILSDDGYRVAPFKAQNMSLNSAATPEGREIGRAQAMQAEAARIAPSVDMNPILLKPISNQGSQVVILGKPHGIESAAEYHLNRVEQYFPIVCEAYQRLAEYNDIIVLEGAGSPAEINLKQHDIVNMRMAQAANARCLLVGDIDRGGVFASLYGTMALLEPDERARIVAFAINKFRGDQALLDPGVRDMAQRLQLPSAGVIPWLPDIGLDEEDDIAYEDAPRVRQRSWQTGQESRQRRLRIAVIAIPRMSNRTDFDALSAEPSVDLAYADYPNELQHADVIILPGTKTTIEALQWLRDNHFDSMIAQRAKDALIIGICGGMQMLGTTISDPYYVESGGFAEGLALLPLTTELALEKITQRVQLTIRSNALFGVNSGEVSGHGYEIHMGRSMLTTNGDTSEALMDIKRDNDAHAVDGARSADDRVIGTYVHGLFVSDHLRHACIEAMRTKLGLDPAKQFVQYEAQREARFDRLAAHVRQHLNLSLLLPS